LALKKIALLLIVCTFCLKGYCQEKKYWQQQVNYTIEVSLNDKEHTLEGFVKMNYQNNSPDTLTYIWFHLWPNAYKNDQTAFSEQLLQNNKTNFYFSKQEDRGYINRLNFQVNGATARLEDHPNYIDVVKVILPAPLLPHTNATITTPFHLQLPKNFSRGGHIEQSYQITQWYPKPAVYDAKGWHPLPYLDQGEFYSEFGHYEVRITIPDNYVVAATGQLQNDEELLWLQQRHDYTPPSKPTIKKNGPKKLPHSKKIEPPLVASSTKTKTLVYVQDKVHDFSWFASKYLRVRQDTLQLPSGKIIQAFAYYPATAEKNWSHAIQYIKEAILTRSQWMGEYPYKVVSAVEMMMGNGGAMEYPTITNISPVKTNQQLAFMIEHELGHNWLYGILANNERAHPWMDEGLNTYYDNRFAELKKQTTDSINTKQKKSFIQRKLPDDMGRLLLTTLEGIKKVQPINNSAETFTEANYAMVVYYKTGQWVAGLEKFLGKKNFDSCMQSYYRQWQFKHPYPEDIKRLFDTVSGKSTDSFFNQLNTVASLYPPQKKKLAITGLFNLSNTFSKQYLSVLPVLGGNLYDGLMLGVALHNYQLPLPKFQFFVAPTYATKSKQLAGLARASYTWYPTRTGYAIEAGASAASFSDNTFTTNTNNKLFLGVTKIVPFVRLTVQPTSALSTLRRHLQFKTFFIQEEQLRFQQIATPSGPVDEIGKKIVSRYLTQLQLVVENTRILYPYKALLQLEQGNGFLRTAFTASYFLNYPQGNGARIRLFAAKFSYLGGKTTAKQFSTEMYHPKLTAVRGSDDYTYSNYFLGRNGAEGADLNLTDQQIMVRDGGLKLRTDVFSGLQGRSDNWVAAINLSTPIPAHLLPIPKIDRIRLFLDVGTYAEGWKTNAPTSKFLYTGGLQLSLCKNLVNVYLPLIYNKELRDNLKSVPEENKRKISFSIDLQNFSFKHISPYIPL
jgi:hypothetical protein